MEPGETWHGIRSLLSVCAQQHVKGSKPGVVMGLQSQNVPSGSWVGNRLETTVSTAQMSAQVTWAQMVGPVPSLCNRCCDLHINIKVS